MHPDSACSVGKSAAPSAGMCGVTAGPGGHLTFSGRRPNVQVTMSVSYEGLTFERPGHATVRIETGEGFVSYVDPWSEVVDDEPTDGDVIFVTHEDFDHFDPDGIDAVATEGATLAVYEGVDTGDVERAVQRLPLQGQTTVAGIDVETIPAYNDPDGSHVDDDGEPFHAEGEGVGLVLDIDGVSVYYPSDTDFLDHHRDVRADVFLPPIGGHYTMNRQAAADFARSVDPALVLPVHYDTFDGIDADAGAFAEDLSADGIRVELF